jgi:hypothetical protein
LSHLQELDGGDKANKSLDKAKETGKDGDKKLYINPANNISPEDPLFMSVSDDRGLLCSSPSWSRNEELPTSGVTRTISVLGMTEHHIRTGIS